MKGFCIHLPFRLGVLEPPHPLPRNAPNAAGPNATRRPSMARDLHPRRLAPFENDQPRPAELGQLRCPGFAPERDEGVMTLPLETS